MKLCELCEGKKIVFGFGGMKKSCPRCAEVAVPIVKRPYVRKIEKNNGATTSEE
jgi:hypothetical protein